LQVLQENQKNLTRLLEYRDFLEHHLSLAKKNEGLPGYWREYEVLSEEFHIPISLQEFCTIKSEVIGDMDASSHEGSLIKPQYDLLEVNAYTHVKEVCNEVEKTLASNLSLEISYEVDNTSTCDGQVESTNDDYDEYDELCVELNLAHSSSSTQRLGHLWKP